jgi:hypothetical protein
VEDTGMDGSMILKPVFKKRYVVMVWMEVTWPTILITMILPSAKRRRRVFLGHAAGVRKSSMPVGPAIEFYMMARLILKLILEFWEIYALLWGG